MTKRQWVRSDKRRAEVLVAVRRLSRNGTTPSVRAIATAVGLKSAASAHRYLQMLVASGDLAQTPFGHYVLKKKR